MRNMSSVTPEQSPRASSRMVLSMVLAIVAAFASTTAFANYLVTDGTVVGVANTSSNQANFGVLVTGGSGNLCDGVYIEFPEADAANKEAHARAYATALAALTTGLPVRIYNYVDSTCSRASYIEIRR